MKGSNFIVTFGHGQWGGTLKDSYIQFENATDLQVRRWMTKHFDRKWSGIYSGQDALAYHIAHQPAMLAAVTFAQAGDGEFDIDQYEVKTKDLGQVSFTDDETALLRTVLQHTIEEVDWSATSDAMVQPDNPGSLMHHYDTAKRILLKLEP